MKRLSKIFILFLFVLNFFVCNNGKFNNSFCFAVNENYSYTVFFNGKVYKFKDSDFVPEMSEKQKEIYQNLKT